MLNSTSPPLSNIAGIGEIFSGPAIGTMFNLPGLPPSGDPRTPDIVITTNVGVIYTGGKKKVMEHGGFAPTIVQALGLDPESLQAVRIEHTQTLPGIHL